jgi:hypothetical protein
MFTIGKTMLWHRVSDDRRRTDKIPVKILKVARNGVFVEIVLPESETPPDGIKRKARVARQYILPVPPKLAPRPASLGPPAPPPAAKAMLGQPAGWIPPVLPKKWDPMIMVGDADRIVHAVPTGTRAMCGYESTTGWQWACGQDVTCKQCWRKHLEAEFEKNGIVQHLRRLGHAGPITREDYISFNWAGCSIRPWTAEHEDSLPALLRDWPRLYKNARRRERYSERKYGAWAREQVDAMVAELRKKGE